MSALALLRHGATAWNRKRLIQGRADPPLDDAGRRAVRTWQMPADLRAAEWVTSPQRRARETAELLLGRPAAVDARLIEMDWGAWEGRRLADLRAELGDDMRRLEASGLDFRPPGGESPRDVQERLRSFLVECALRDRPTVAVTHKGIIRALYALAAGWDMAGKAPHRLADGALQVFEVVAGGGLRVLRLNQRLDGA